MLTDQQKSLVKDSWMKVAGDPDRIAGLFYGRLFELDPSLRRLFENTSIVDQGRKITQMVTVFVGDLEMIESIVPAVRTLGRRHVEYGVTEEQYDKLGASLYWALEQVLGPEWTPETAEAWKNTYELMADTMKAGAREAR
jgi:hemoglobin-like flavoprotein